MSLPASTTLAIEGLTKLVTDYQEYGIFYQHYDNSARDGHARRGILGNSLVPRTLLRDASRDLGWYLVSAHTSEVTYGGITHRGARVHIPRVAFNRGLGATLTLVSKGVVDHRWATPGEGIWTYNGKSFVDFVGHGAEGIRIIQHFAASCRFNDDVIAAITKRGRALIKHPPQLRLAA